MSTTTIRRRKVRNEHRWVLDWTAIDGKRQRRFFDSRRAAEAEAATLEIQRKQTGEVWLTLTAEQRNEILGVFIEVQSRGTSLRRVWEEWREGAGTSAIEPMLLGKAVTECLAAKRSAGRRDRYVDGLEVILRAFSKGREATKVSAITESEVDRWLRDRYTAPWSQATALNRLSTLFSFCVRRRWTRENPCDRIERITIEQQPPAILTVRQAAKVLVFVKRRHPRGLAWFTLAMMAGIRPEECDRLSWDDVDLKAGIVTVDAAASKVRQRRIVHLQPAAVAWMLLAKNQDAELPLPHSTRRRHLRAVREMLRWPAWKKDVLRHTCASYLMAQWQDAGRVAAELGNSAGVLMRHYRELVRREDAERFWRLVPRKPTTRTVDTISLNDTIAP